MSIMPDSSRGFVRTYSILLAILAMFDAFAMGLLALILTPLVSGTPWKVPGIGVEVAGTGLFIAIGVVCGVIILKGVLALVLQWWATRRLASLELAMGDRLFASYLVAPWVERLRRNSSDLVRIADVGIANTIAGFLLPFMTLTGEVLTFVVVVLVLAIAQPLTAVVALVYLGSVAVLLYFLVSRRAVVAGRVNRDYSFRVAQLLTEMVTALKEVTLRNKEGEVAEVVHANRIHTSRARANIQFLGIVPRYVLESALIGGFAVIGGVGYATGGAEQAMLSVSLFALAGFRMAPSLQRFQSIISQTSSSAPFAEVVVADIKTVEKFAGERKNDRSGEKLPTGAKGLELSNVSFRYSPDGDDALKNISLSIPFGSTVAFVGSSG
ncbi:MAG: ABC transporter ATP-binding protein, partial [Specibacter sp.]